MHVIFLFTLPHQIVSKQTSLFIHQIKKIVDGKNDSNLNIYTFENINILFILCVNQCPDRPTESAFDINIFARIWLIFRVKIRFWIHMCI